MKKTLIVTLALVFVLGLAGTAFANPYSDVPAGHWAYKAVYDLQKVGVMEGAAGKFMGNQTLTRYEIAAITARAMAKADKADAATKATIDKLAVEFSKELNDLGVRVAKLEKNSQAIKFGGESRIRYTSLNDVAQSFYTSNPNMEGSTAFDWRQRLHLNAQVADNVKYTGRIEATGGMGTGSSALSFNRNFFTISNTLGLDTITVGRFGLYAGNYLAIGNTSNNDGFAFATKAGDFNLSGFWVVPKDNMDLKGAFVEKAWDDFSVNVGYIANDRIGLVDGTKSSYVADKSTALDFGVWAKVAPGVNFVGEYVKTNNDLAPDASAWAAQLSYTTGKSNIKKFFSTADIVDRTQAGEQGFAVSYRSIEAFGLPVNGRVGQFGGYYGTALQFSPAEYMNSDVKGMYYGYQNVLAKNILLNVEHQALQQESGSDVKAKFTSAYVQFYF